MAFKSVRGYEVGDTFAEGDVVYVVDNGSYLFRYYIDSTNYEEYFIYKDKEGNTDFSNIDSTTFLSEDYITLRDVKDIARSYVYSTATGGLILNRYYVGGSNSSNLLDNEYTINDGWGYVTDSEYVSEVEQTSLVSSWVSLRLSSASEISRMSITKGLGVDYTTEMDMSIFYFDELNLNDWDFIQKNSLVELRVKTLSPSEVERVELVKFYYLLDSFKVSSLNFDIGVLDGVLKMYPKTPSEGLDWYIENIKVTRL